MDNITSARNISGLEPMSALRGLTPLCVPMEFENSFAEEARLRANPRVASLWERLGLFYLLEEPQAAPVSNTRVIVNNFTAQLVFRLCTMNHTDRLIERYQPGFVFPENLRRVSQENVRLIQSREVSRFLHSFTENSRYAEEVSRVFRLVFEKETGGIPLQTVCRALAALLGSSGGGAVFTAQQRRIFERIAAVLGTEYPDSPAAGAIASVGAAAGFTDEQRRNIMNAVGKTGTRPQMDAVRTVFRLAETVKTSGEAEKAILTEVRNYGFARQSERFREAQSSTERYSGIVPIGFQQESELPQEGRTPAVPCGIVKPLYGEITSAALLFAESVERSECGEPGEIGRSGEIVEHGKRGKRSERSERGDSGRTGEIGKSGESSESSVLGESGKIANPHTISNTAERRSAEFQRISEIMSGGFAGHITELLNSAERSVSFANTMRNISVSNLNSPQLTLRESAQGASSSRGSIGSAGSLGSLGLVGSVGSVGSAGSRGLPGSAGTPGVPGDSGIPGAVGRSGLPGVPGSSGVAGVSGDPGTAGVPGKNGVDSVGKVSMSSDFSAADPKNPVGAVQAVNTLTREISEHDSISERIFRESTAAKLAERIGAIQGGFGSAYTEMQLFNILHQPERGVIPIPREAAPGGKSAQNSNITRLTQFSDISQLSNVSSSGSVNTVSSFSNVSSLTRVGSTVDQTNAVNVSNAAVTANISNVTNAVNVANTVNAANVANINNAANSSNVYSAAETSFVNPAENTDVTNVINIANAASVTNTANTVHNITQTAENPGNPRNPATGEVLPPETARESLQSVELYTKPESVPETASRIVPGNVPESAPRLSSGTSLAKPVAPTGSYRDRLDSGTLAALDRLISESRTAGKVSEIRETQPEPAELSLNTAEQSAVQGDVLRSVSIVRESMVRRTESHITRLIERAAESALPKAPETKPFKFRTAEGAGNMVMLVPPTEMDRFRAQQSYMSSMPPIELKEPPKAPESAPATTRTVTNNRPAVVRTSVDSTVSVDSLSRDEISRLADKVYERIETKLTRERRRMGL